MAMVTSSPRKGDTSEGHECVALLHLHAAVPVSLSRRWRRAGCPPDPVLSLDASLSLSFVTLARSP